MNQPPNSGMNQPPGYGVPQQPQGYGPPPQSGPVPQSGSYGPPPSHGYGPPPSTYQQPHGMRGMTRQMFNPASYRQVGSGSWAAASLILAIIGWVTFGCLGILTWPLGLLFGLIGMVGQKRAKGMSFAGFMLSAIGIAGLVALVATGEWMRFQTESLAEDAGKPVVAAIAEFKSDNGRVPNSLDELVTMGYLPQTWDEGFDDINNMVEAGVRGRKWGEFLAYKPGADSGWVGTPDSTGLKDLLDTFKPTDEDKGSQTYGLTYIGLDNVWGNDDDTAVSQSPEKPYDLTTLWGGDETTREAMKKKRELQRMIQQVDRKLEETGASATNAKEALTRHENRLNEIAKQKGLTTGEQIRSDPDTREWLKLLGETRKRHEITMQRERSLTSTRYNLEAQMERLGNQVELAKLADNKEQLAELQKLLDDSRATLDGDESSYFSDKTESDFADDWLKKNFK